MASVIKRGKKWFAQFQLADGSWKRVKGYTDRGETERLGRRLEDEQAKIRLGDIDYDSINRRLERSKTIETQIEEYERFLKVKGVDADHLAYTIRDIKIFVGLEWLKPEARIKVKEIKSAGQITSQLIDHWVESQKEADKRGEKGNSPSTINRRVGSVKAFLKKLSEDGGVSKYTLFKYPKLPVTEKDRRRVMRALSECEKSKLLGCLNLKRQQLYSVALRTGLRLGELRKLTAGMIDFQNNIIILPDWVTKAGVQQTVPIHKAIEDTLKNLMAGKKPENRLFPKIPSRKTVITNLKADCEALGINSNNVSFHSLRHTFCTLLAKANVHPALLQKLARHADVKTTLKFYVHLQRDDELAAILKVA